ncbi:MAG: type II toxin-antitoxin system VapC family toxin [Candidatus Sphingomonas phytovorans]|nr:type II toxin-antitoxin system VapC family toxin [Sphingomonas sp.]WEK01522.1 MAG: type II toxin-antitoxin system VapC family toxin [Sphingomonas sp.]
MRYFIDTNCCIYLFAGTHPALTRRIADTVAGDIGLSAIVLAEFALGLQRDSASPDPRLALLIEQMPVQPFDRAAAEAYARLPFRRGRFDRLLAAHAVSRGLALITNNPRDFADIPGLKVENWTI